MNGRISRRTRWTLIGAIACLSVVGFVGTAARLVSMMASASSVQKPARPGQLLILKTHPLLPAFTVDATAGKPGKGTIRLGLSY
jgi:hypothetical protein